MPRALPWLTDPQHHLFAVTTSQARSQHRSSGGKQHGPSGLRGAKHRKAEAALARSLLTCTGCVRVQRPYLHFSLKHILGNATETLSWKPLEGRPTSSSAPSPSHTLQRLHRKPEVSSPEKRKWGGKPIQIRGILYPQLSPRLSQSNQPTSYLPNKKSSYVLKIIAYTFLSHFCTMLKISENSIKITGISLDIQK